MRLLGLYETNGKLSNLTIGDLVNLMRTTKGIGRLRRINLLLI